MEPDRLLLLKVNERVKQKREEKRLFIFPPAVLIFVKDIHAIAGPGGAGEFEQERGPLPLPRCTSQSPVARLEF